MKRIVGWLMVMCLIVGVAACSDPDQGPPLGPFAAIAKTEADPPFNLTAPTSKSPADFHYTSSNLAVATISGSLVTITGAGTSTITAFQNSVGGWGPTSATTTLTVTAVACNSGEVRVNGVCTPAPTCVSPATPQNNQCIPPASSAALVHANGLDWMGVSFPANWTNANGYCTTTTIAGVAGVWRQPSTDELKALQASNAITGQGWVVGPTWSSDIGTTSNNIATHVVIDLSSGTTVDRADTAGAYVACVRAAGTP
jgi:hypothetical protein